MKQFTMNQLNNKGAKHYFEIGENTTVKYAMANLGFTETFVEIIDNARFNVLKIKVVFKKDNTYFELIEAQTYGDWLYNITIREIIEKG